MTCCYLCGHPADLALSGIPICRRCRDVHSLPTPEPPPAPSYTGGWWPVATAKEDE